MDLLGSDIELQRSFSDEFKKKGRLALFGCGTAPGMSNIMAAHGVNLVEKPESIEILDACVDMVPDTEPIEVDGQKVSPRALLLTLLSNQLPETQKAPDFRGHMMVVVKGEQGGKRVEYTITEYATERLTLEMQKKGIFSSYRTGLYAAIATLMIGRGQVEKKGALYPEECIPTGLFLKEAAKAGIEVDVTGKEWV